MRTLDHDQLRRRLRLGDASALSRLFDQHWFPLVRYLRGMVGSTDAAEDLAQETFVRFWDRRTKLDAAGPIEPLLYKIARNAAFDAIRRRQTREGHAATVRAAPLSHSAETPDHAVQASELEAAALEAVAALPARRREIFELVRHSGLTYRQIADTLGISTQTVANQMSRAMQDLRAALAEHLTDIGTP